MCELSSSTPTLGESNEGHSHTHTTKIKEPDMLALLIPKPPTTFQQPQKNQKPHETTHFSLAFNEAKCIANTALPMVLTGLLLYSRSVISMLFLGRAGDLALAGGSLAIGFANITGYSILSGLAMGMEPICVQAFGAKRFKLLGFAMQRTIVLLLLTSIFISFLWLNMKNILLLCGQQEDIATQAQSFILYSLPDLVAQSLLHPLRIYLRSQSITLPLTYSAFLSILLHLPINYLLVSVFKLGIKGIALGAVWTNFNLVFSLLLYIWLSGIYSKTWTRISLKGIFCGWKALLNLAIPSCISVCLEWWCTCWERSGCGESQKGQTCSTGGAFFSYVMGLSALFFAVSVRHVWASMFTRDAEIIALTATVLPIIGLCELGNCPQTTVCGVLRGTARPKLGANINLGCFYIVGMPIAVWLGFFAGFDFKGLWLGLLAAQASCMITMLFVLARTNWEDQVQRAKQLTSSDATEEEQEQEQEHHGNSSAEECSDSNV
ncbi:hypothetical protein ACSQ67_003679 [Phaseolus vulgaris]